MLDRQEYKELFIPYEEDGKMYIKASKHLYDGVIDQLFDELNYCEKPIKKRRRSREPIVFVPSEKDVLLHEIHELKEKLTLALNKRDGALSCLGCGYYLSGRCSSAEPCKRKAVDRFSPKDVLNFSIEEKIAYQRNIITTLQKHYELLKKDALIDSFVVFLNEAYSNGDTFLKMTRFFGGNFCHINLLQSNKIIEDFSFYAVMIKKFYAVRRIQKPLRTANANR